MEYPKKVLTETVSAFLFATQESALQAVQTVNEGEGIPVGEDAITQTYTTPFFHEGDWYVKCDAVTSKYLANPVQIEVEVK